LPGDHLPTGKDGASATQKLQTNPASVALGPVSARAEVVVSLNKEAVRVELSVDDRIKLDDQRLRKWMAIGFVATFIVGDILTLGALAGLGWSDQANIERTLISPSDRIIDRHVIMTLLGATTVQVGTIAAIIVRYLFPGRSRDGP
jgi:hypothetical protein